jgi:hypothetical protein
MYASQPSRCDLLRRQVKAYDPSQDGTILQIIESPLRPRPVSGLCHPTSLDRIAVDVVEGKMSHSSPKASLLEPRRENIGCTIQRHKAETSVESSFIASTSNPLEENICELQWLLLSMGPGRFETFLDPSRARIRF